MELVEELGRRLVRRSSFDRQFVRSGDELRFREGPLRPVRAAPEDQRDRYVELAMDHAVAFAGWTQLVLLPLGVATAPFLLSPRLLWMVLAFDLVIVWAVSRFGPGIAEKRRRVRGLVEQWPVVAPSSFSGYFRSFWSAASLAKIGAGERRILLLGGLLMTPGGVLLIAAGDIIGWLGLTMGVLSLLFAALAYRHARSPYPPR